MTREDRSFIPTSIKHPVGNIDKYLSLARELQATVLFNLWNEMSDSLPAKSDLLKPESSWQSPIKSELKTPEITLHWKLLPASPSEADHLSFLEGPSTRYGVSTSHQSPLPRYGEKPSISYALHRVCKGYRTRAALWGVSRHHLTSDSRALVSRRCNRLMPTEKLWAEQPAM